MLTMTSRALSIFRLLILTSPPCTVSSINFTMWWVATLGMQLRINRVKSRGFRTQSWGLPSVLRMMTLDRFYPTQPCKPHELWSTWSTMQSMVLGQFMIGALTTYYTQPPTFICYSCDGVSVQHSIQEWVRGLSNLEKREKEKKRVKRVRLNGHIMSWELCSCMIKRNLIYLGQYFQV